MTGDITCKVCLPEGASGYLTVQSSSGGASRIPCPGCNAEKWKAMHETESLQLMERTALRNENESLRMSVTSLKAELDRAKRELWECLKAAGADYSSLTGYAEPWNHMQSGEALQAANELRKDYDDGDLVLVEQNRTWRAALAQIAETDTLRPSLMVNIAKDALDGQGGPIHPVPEPSTYREMTDTEAAEFEHARKAYEAQK